MNSNEQAPERAQEIGRDGAAGAPEPAGLLTVEGVAARDAVQRATGEDQAVAEAGESGDEAGA